MSTVYTLQFTEDEMKLLFLAWGMLTQHLEEAPEELINGLLQDSDIRQSYDSRNELLAATNNTQRKICEQMARKVAPLTRQG